MRGAGGWGSGRSHGCADVGALRAGEVRRRFAERNNSKFSGLSGTTEKLLTQNQVKPKLKMIYPIVKFGDPVLEKSSATVTTFDDEIKKLVADMFESMSAARGVGLAAPQI